MNKSIDLPILPFASKKRWAAWLAKQHQKSTGVWMKLAKKGSGIAAGKNLLCIAAQRQSICNLIRNPASQERRDSRQTDTTIREHTGARGENISVVRGFFPPIEAANRSLRYKSRFYKPAFAFHQNCFGNRLIVVQRLDKDREFFP